MLALLCACEGLQVEKANEAVNKKAVVMYNCKLPTQLLCLCKKP